jgi:serine/threonine-protein kinase
MILMHVQQLPVPPSERLGKPVPAELERLVLACLAKRPADRPRSAAALAAALGAIGS